MEEELRRKFDTWDAPNKAMFLSRMRWLETARLNQLPPGDDDWRVWLLLAGRGFGKTKCAAEWCGWEGWKAPRSRTAVIAPTFADGRDICFEGESGLENVIPSVCIRSYNRSMGEMVLVNESSYRLFSADEPDRMRGHSVNRAWADEAASYRGKTSGRARSSMAELATSSAAAAMAQIEMIARLRPHPCIIITTTPRPLKILKEIKARLTTRVSTGSTYDNAANLAPEAMQAFLTLYEGTRLGDQELHAHILEDVEGALWGRELIEDAPRLKPGVDELPNMRRVVIAIDPATTANKRSNETGMIVLGLGFNRHAYVLADASGKYTPQQWAVKALNLVEEFRADCIVAEANNGGDLVETNIRSSSGGTNVRIKLVHATKGKIVRAEPAAGLYEQKKVHHYGFYRELEDQMCTFSGDEGEESPDRLDALVWGLFELMLTGKKVPFVGATAIAQSNYWSTESAGGGIGVTLDSPYSGADL